MKQLYCFLDGETTGLCEKTNAIHQIGMIITDADLNQIDKIDLKFRPDPSKVIDKDDGSGILVSEEVLMQRELSHLEAFKLFMAFLEKHVNKYDKKDKLTFVAYNAQFDEKFVRAFMESCSNNAWFGSYFWFPVLCVMQGCAWFAQGVRDQIPNMKLATMCQAAEIEFDDNEAHDAFYDIEKTLELFAWLKPNFTNA